MGLQEYLTQLSEKTNEMFNFSDPLYGELIVSVLILIGFFILGWVVNHVFEHYFSKLAKKTKTKPVIIAIWPLSQASLFLIILILFIILPVFFIVPAS